ncbi:MAG TPA: hypothetical protein PKA62_13215 [Thermoanaerobaculia bacterium]|nr:hypothetical protein [Thermoanaerobaculia bacterium]
MGRPIWKYSPAFCASILAFCATIDASTARVMSFAKDGAREESQDLTLSPRRAYSAPLSGLSRLQPRTSCPKA